MVKGVLVTPRSTRKSTRGRGPGLPTDGRWSKAASAMTPLLSLYLALTWAAAPIAPPVLLWRRARGKEDAERWRERLGTASLPRPEGSLVWFHGASVGESMSVLPLIERLRRERDDVSILVTSGTVSAARLLGRRLPDGVKHQFVPVDVKSAVTQFLDHWRPDLAVCIESEIWPRLLRSVKQRAIPALLLNARMSERSQRRWRRIRKTARELLTVFDYVQAQDEGTGIALRHLGVSDRLTVTGSFKGAAAPLPCDPAELEHLRASLGGRHAWVAASTHRGEEDLAIEAHRRFTDIHRDALLIIAPRHPERGDEIASLLDASGLPWARRGAAPPPSEVSIYLADTLGELGLWYRMAEVAFVGGSTRGIGGHNPYEPIALDVPVLHGPDTGNFAAIYSELDADGATRMVESAEDLAEALFALCGTEEGRAVTLRAARIARGGTDALERALVAINDHLVRKSPAGPIVTNS